MKIETSGKKKVVKMSKKEWLAIGKQTGWSKKYAQLEEDRDLNLTDNYVDVTNRLDDLLSALKGNDKVVYKGQVISIDELQNEITRCCSPLSENPTDEYKYVSPVSPLNYGDKGKYDSLINEEKPY